MDFRTLETKWQDYWKAKKLFHAPEKPSPDKSGKKYYDLVMFAYPSGDIHIGHFRNYTLGDALARFKRMQGYSVLHPFGWDAFGLPAEEAAIKHGIHPREWTLKNIEVSRATLRRIGISYDWDREVITCLPNYYRWNQWLFLKMHELGLAYRAKSFVNWCPSCKTVLANEQVHEGACWRCHSEVVKKELLQWFLRITAYADRLLQGLDKLSAWPDPVKAMQRNWIGRSEGARVIFTIAPSGTVPDSTDGRELPVYTTRPDTLYGVTFVTLAPEHPLASSLSHGLPQAKEVARFLQESLRHSDRERMAPGEKNGVFTGRFAVHPLTGEKIPIWIADYVLAGYGTGVVMGVPAHDQRDFLFAEKYRLPVKAVIQPLGELLSAGEMRQAYEDPGVMANSAEFSGLPSREGIKKITEELKRRGLGDFEIRYKLRDWLISRQRFWGTPIPMIHCDSCGVVPVSVESLPVLLPEGKVDFLPKGRSPLADVKEFIETVCPKCGGKAKRDADTMDTFVDSSWYFLRYLDSKNKKKPFDEEKANAWMPVDQYIGGIEHATMHLIYFRFFTMVLHDLGYVAVEEPATALFNQGMVLDRRGEVMSKSKGNAVSPADLLKEEGADVVRIAMFFAGPAEKEMLWNQDGIGGARRFLLRVWRFLEQSLQSEGGETPGGSNEVNKKIHQTIQRVTEDLERFSFHTAIAALMECLNVLEEEKPRGRFAFELMKPYVQLLAPFAPHAAEEMWERLGNPPSVFESSWPSFDSKAVQEDTVEMAVQVNGKVRDHVAVSRKAGEEAVKAAVMELPRIKELLMGRELKRMVVVPNKLVNIVIS